MGTRFDERQTRAQGEAFRYGFFTLLGSLALYACLGFLLADWCENAVACAFCICLGVTVVAVLCIRRDAYTSLRMRPAGYILLFAVMAAVNLSIGVSHILRGDIVENGLVCYRAINLLVGAMAVVILAVYVAKRLADRREDEA